jgi:predicted RNase H-like nuclease (RuvC/YqgF family)
MKITINEYHDLMAKLDELERELKERGVDIQDLTSALRIEREENARLQAAINGFAEQYREVKSWHDAPLIKRLFDFMTTDTPRTESIMERGPLQRPTLSDLAAFARELEREISGLNDALKIANRSADEQMRYKREAEAERDRMKFALEHILEYWNRDQNETAMTDALWHIIETASDALPNTRDQGHLPAAQGVANKEGANGG